MDNVRAQVTSVRLVQLAELPVVPKGVVSGRALVEQGSMATRPRNAVGTALTKLWKRVWPPHRGHRGQGLAWPPAARRADDGLHRPGSEVLEADALERTQMPSPIGNVSRLSGQLPGSLG